MYKYFKDNFKYYAQLFKSLGGVRFCVFESSILGSLSLYLFDQKYW